MITHTVNGSALTFEGASGPRYTASLEDILKVAEKFLPAELAQLRDHIESLIKVFHEKSHDTHQGDIKLADVPDGLSALIILAALRAEKELLGDLDERKKYDCCRNFLRTGKHVWSCTLPVHDTPEHVGHTFPGHESVSVCDRWPDGDGDPR